MLHSALGFNGAMTAPHRAAALAGRDVLREGGTAIEAMVVRIDPHKLEERFDPGVVAALRAAGHDVEMIAPYSDLAGHAGAVAHHPSGLMGSAPDPRSDGAAITD
ncbi:MAG: hypothetical protein WEB56_11750 [Roseovarius sp.]